MPVTFVRPSDVETTLHCAPAAAAVLSWNTRAAEGTISLRVRFVDGYRSSWLPYVKWGAQGRHSLSPRAEEVTIETDVVRANKPFDALDVRAAPRLDAIALATPCTQTPRDGARTSALELDVPQYSQYVVSEERGWCSPASLAMVLAFHGCPLDVAAVAAAVYDGAYGGTGNWTFNAAYASTFGLRAFVAYLRDLVHAGAFIASGLPLVLSYAWNAGELEGAPLPESLGHLSVLRGFDRNGDPIVNDPAQPAPRTTYRRDQFERLWLAHGGIAYVLAPTSGPDPEALVNDAR